MSQPFAHQSNGILHAQAAVIRRTVFCFSFGIDQKALTCSKLVGRSLGVYATTLVPKLLAHQEIFLLHAKAAFGRVRNSESALQLSEDTYLPIAVWLQLGSGCSSSCAHAACCHSIYMPHAHEASVLLCLLTVAQLLDCVD